MASDQLKSPSRAAQNPKQRFPCGSTFASVCESAVTCSEWQGYAMRLGPSINCGAIGNQHTILSSLKNLDKWVGRAQKLGTTYKVGLTGL